MNSGNSFAIWIWTSFGKLCMDPVAACKLSLFLPLKNFFLPKIQLKTFFLAKIPLKYFCLGAVHKFLLLYYICVCFSVVICICELYMSWVKSSSWVLKSQLQRIHSPRFEAQVESVSGSIYEIRAEANGWEVEGDNSDIPNTKYKYKYKYKCSRHTWRYLFTQLHKSMWKNMLKIKPILV